MGGAATARGMDSGQDSAQHRDVGPGLNADAVSAGWYGAKTPAELLRRERFATVAGTDPACLSLPSDEPESENARASD